MAEPRRQPRCRGLQRRRSRPVRPLPAEPIRNTLSIPHDGFPLAEATNRPRIFLIHCQRLCLPTTSLQTPRLPRTISAVFDTASTIKRHPTFSQHKTMRTVLTNHSNYNARKNFLDLPLTDYRVRRVADFYKLLAHGLFRTTGRTHLRWLNSYRDFELYGGDLCHFFNGLSFGCRPWVTTYEWALPVWGRGQRRRYKKASQLLAGNACKKIIAMSAWAERCQDGIAHEFFPTVHQDVMAKSCVLHPAQRLYLANISEKREPKEHVVFSMVGHDFFRKGGKEILAVFDRLLTKGLPLKLNIVSRIKYGDIPTRSTAHDKHQAMKIIEKHSASIQLHHQQPHDAVIEIFKQSDVGLLTSFHETYGYSVIEAQSCGCPVVTTDIYALPEINNDDLGWIVRTPAKDYEGGVSYINAAERARLPKVIEEQLENIIETIVSDRTALRSKGARCIHEIRSQRSPEITAQRLQKVYDEALN